MILADLISVKNSLTVLNIFTKCSGLNIYKSNIHISKCYSDIHEIYINNFMKETSYTLQILKQPL